MSSAIKAATIMKSTFHWLLLCCLLLYPAPGMLAADTGKAAPPDKSPAAPYATALATVTGVAISPLLGTGALGIYQNLQAETEAEKAALPWYAQWSFIVPALLVVAVCAAKDSLGAVVPPGLKKPLDVLETIENKASGLVAAGAVVPLTMSSLSKMIVGQTPSPDLLLHSGTATLAVGAIDGAWLLNLLTVPFGVAVFAIVWMASHAINALILLSPWGAIDAVLKGARTALLGLVTLTATLNPWIGAALSLLVVIVAYLVAGWAFRLTIFGTIFSWDFFTLGKKRCRVTAGAPQPLFSSDTLARQGVPLRTWGTARHEPENGRVVFCYRPWLFLPERQLDVKLESPAVGKGLFFSTVQDGERTAFVLPPRYRGHEAELASNLGLEGGVREAGLLKAWSTVRELFSGSAARAQIV